MLCPVCKVNLHMTERQGVEIDYCPQCRGVWLDRGELDKILERSRQDAPAASAPAPAAPAPAAAPPPRYGERDDDRRRYGDDDRRFHEKRRKKSFFEEIFD